MAGYIAVANWEKFQHYKDRNPPWIKLHVATLDDYEFSCLQDASKWLAVGLWMLASKHENRIPLDEKWIASKLNLTAKLDLDPLVSAGFITIHDMEQDASIGLADCKQNATRSVSVSGSKRKVGKKKETGPLTEADLLFELARERYPRRQGASWPEAKAQWDARVKEGVEPDAMLAGVDAYATYVKHHGTEQRFMKLPASFLSKKARHWENDWSVPESGSDSHLPIAEIIECLRGEYAAWLGSADTKIHAFRGIEKDNPELWKRAGPAMEKLRFIPLFDHKARGDMRGLAQEIERQLSNGRS